MSHIFSCFAVYFIQGEINKMKKKTLFKEPPRSKRIAAAVKISSPREFRESIQKLGKQGFTLHERRALILAQNRARAQLKRKNLSEKERLEFAEISGVDLNEMFKI